MSYDGRWIVTPHMDGYGVISIEERDRRTDVVSEFCPVMWPAQLSKMEFSAAMLWRQNVPRSSR